MKSIKKKSSSKKIFIIAPIAALLLAGASLTYAAINNIGPFSDEPDSSTFNDKPPTKEQIDDQERTKQQTIETEAESDDDLPSKNADESSTPSESGDGTKRNVTVTIERTNQSSESVSIVVAVDTIDSNSSCTIVMSKSGQTSYRQKVGTQTYPSYSLCKGFTVPKNKLSNGSWKVTITYESDRFKGSASQSVNIQ